MNRYISNLEERGMIHNFVPGLSDQLDKETTPGYIGFDLTAESLHIGNMAAIMLAKHLQLAGHKPIILLGGATSMAGDPSFKVEERRLLSRDEIINNQEKIKLQFDKFLDFSTNTNIRAEIFNNYDWFKEYNFVNFIRDVGKHITINYMLSKDSVKNRLEYGLSFAEFSYQLMQGYDFYYLYKNKGVKLQLGGADQWGNLTTGLELIRRKIGGEAFALTTPLITKQDGTKFGKSEGGQNVWLDPKMTSPYKFFQFWLNVSDADAKKLIKAFTLLSIEEISNICIEHDKAPHNYILQHALAKEVTTLVHSKDAYEQSYKASKIIFGNDISLFYGLIDSTILEAFDGVARIDISRSILDSGSFDIVSFLSKDTNGIICNSKLEAKRMLEGGGIRINKVKVDGEFSDAIELINNKYIVVQKGKKNHYLVIVND